jgi:hypothetical protein
MTRITELPNLAVQRPGRSRYSHPAADRARSTDEWHKEAKENAAA